MYIYITRNRRVGTHILLLIIVIHVLLTMHLLQETYQ